MRHDPPAMNRVLDLLRAEEHEHLHPHAAPDARPAAAPFVTISRQAGAGGRTFACRSASRGGALEQSDNDRLRAHRGR